MKSLFLSILLILSLSAKATDSTLKEAPAINRKKLWTAIGVETAFYAGGMAYLQYVWYKDHDRAPFHYYNDNKGWLQIDKFGHAYGAYLESYIGYHWLRNAGVSRNKALIFGGSLGLILQTPIEVFDGLYEGYGFSKGDMVANAAGAALVVGNELLFREQLVRYKFSYWESRYAAKSNGYLGHDHIERIFYDYNGHSYWLSAPLGRITGIKTLPAWLSISAGYSANGMYGEFKNKTSYRGVPIPPTERYRQYLLSLDVDWSKVKTRSKFLKAVLKGMNFIKVPFPALEYNSKGNFRGYWLYF